MTRPNDRNHGATLAKFFIRLLFSFLWVFCFSCPGFSAEKPSSLSSQKALRSSSPLHIASDRMEVKQQDKIIVFEGHVVVQQDDLTITGNQLRVYTAAKKTGKSSEPGMMDQIDRIEVEGDVKISQKEKMAAAGKAVYYHEEQKIVLMGNPSVSQGQDRVEGRLITLYLSEERSVVEGGEKTPVQAVLHPARKE
jgi:lipopolysaccharide export system protein LptA